MAGIFGDYAAFVPMELLMASTTDRHPTFPLRDLQPCQFRPPQRGAKPDKQHCPIPSARQRVREGRSAQPRCQQRRLFVGRYSVRSPDPAPDVPEGGR